MSHEAFVEFFTKFLDRPEGEAASAEFDGISDPQAFVSRFVEIGAANGYAFTPEEVVAVLQASAARAAQAIGKAEGEMSEDQLSGVVGGVISPAGVIGIEGPPIKSLTAQIWFPKLLGTNTIFKW